MHRTHRIEVPTGRWDGETVWGKVARELFGVGRSQFGGVRGTTRPNAMNIGDDQVGLETTVGQGWLFMIVHSSACTLHPVRNGES